jgi:putative tryptophan/tyrosine transport system substrate-binding protein
MRRREVVTLLCGAAAAWPLPARAQKSENIRRIGVLLGMPPGDRQRQAWLTRFIQGLRELDWIEGRNLRIDIRWDASDPDRAQPAATELVNLAPDAILAHGTPALAAAHRATHSIPIIEYPGQWSFGARSAYSLW